MELKAIKKDALSFLKSTLATVWINQRKERLEVENTRWKFKGQGRNNGSLEDSCSWKEQKQMNMSIFENLILKKATRKHSI